MADVTNPPAFPRLEKIERGDGGTYFAESVGGMSLRDYFAAAALKGLLADLETRMDAKQHARLAYDYADAMLAARENR